MSTMDVTGARLKVARAREHLSDLQGRVGNWLATAEPPRFTIDVEDDGRVHIVRLVDVPTVPAGWSLILGDVLHNLRSALDQLAWQAVISGGGTPGKGTCFPVLREHKDRSITVALKGAAPHLVDAVRRFQPYNRRSTAEALRGEPLWTLHRLDIEDKHRLLVLCPSLVKTFHHNVPEAAVGCRARLTLRPAENGAEVLRMYDLPQPAHSLDLEPQGEWDVWVGETEETAYVEVMALDVLFRPVESIIDGFEQHG